MKKIIFTTTNNNKINRIKALFDINDLEISSFQNLDYKIEEPAETGFDGLENAVLKFRYYFANLKKKIPVLAQDDTLFLSGVSDEDNPKKDIKQPVIKKYGVFTDENAYKYYQGLFNKYGGSLLVEFRYGFALTPFENVTYAERATIKAIATSKISKKRTPGYFLSDMMLVNIDGVQKYYNELTKEELIKIDEDIKNAISKLISHL